MANKKKKKNDLDLEEYNEKDNNEQDEIVTKKVLDEVEEKEDINDDYFKETIDDYYEEENPTENIVDDYLKDNYKEEQEEKEEVVEEKEEVVEEKEEVEEQDNYEDYEIEESSTGDDIREEITKPKVAKFYLVTFIIIIALVLTFFLIKFLINNKAGEEIIKDRKLISDLSNKIDILSTKKIDNKSDYYIENLYSNKEVKEINDHTKELLIVTNIKYQEQTITNEIKLGLKKVGYDFDKHNTTNNMINISEEVDFSKEYQELFNESKKPNKKIENDCITYYYLESTKQFVMDNLCNINKRSSLTEDLYYKDEYTKKKDEAYVYVQKGLKYCYETKDKSTCGVNNGLNNGEKDIMSITPEEYKTFKITEKNKDKFKTFKFTFKKGKDNNYYFVSQKRVR